MFETLEEQQDDEWGLEGSRGGHSVGNKIPEVMGHHIRLGVR